MNRIDRKLEATANILIILVAGFFGFISIQKYAFPPKPENQAVQPKSKEMMQPTIGTKINLLNEDWSQQTKTLVLALQTTCHFCNDSAPFYKRLIQATQGKNVKLVAVFPTKIEESTAHLMELGLTGMEVRQAPLEILQASGTPTLLLINEGGEITNFWVGKLQPERENEVINILNS